MEMSLVDRVGEVLRLQADGAAVGVGLAVLALFSFEKIAAVDLDAGLRGEDRRTRPDFGSRSRAASSASAARLLSTRLWS